MKYSFLLLALLLLTVSSCSSQQGITGPEQRKRVREFRKNRAQEIDITGFWQEYSRTIIKSRMAERPLQFTDSLKIHIKRDSAIRFFDMFGRISGGRLLYKKGRVHLGNGQTFESFEKLGDTLKLGSKGQFSYLRKVPGFYTTPVGPERTDTDENEIGTLEASFLQGKWTVYKKADDNFNRQKSYLKSFDIGDSHADGTYKLVARFHNAELQIRDTGFIEIAGSKMSLDLKKQKQQFTIIKASGSEMILEKDEVVYYLKNLSK